MVFSALFSPISPATAEETVELKPYQQTQLLTGFTEAKQTINISSEVGGKCLTVHAEIGTTIPGSGVLAEIDTTFIKLDIQANRLELESVKRQLKTERKMLARYRTLINKNSATEATLDEVTLKVDLHEMELKTLDNQYLRLQENLARHTITAPGGWTLISRMIEPEEFIQPGQIIGSVGDYSQLIIRLALSNSELVNLRQQEDIALYFPDLKLETVARIFRISPTFNEATKKIAVDLIIDNDERLGLRGGIRGEVRLLKPKEESYLVPTSSLITRYNAHWLVKESGDKVRVLMLGSLDEGATAIISSSEIGLSDRVLKVPPENF